MARIISTYLDIAGALEGISFGGKGVSLAGEATLGIGACQRVILKLEAGAYLSTYQSQEAP